MGRKVLGPEMVRSREQHQVPSGDGMPHQRPPHGYRDESRKPRGLRPGDEALAGEGWPLGRSSKNKCVRVSTPPIAPSPRENLAGAGGHGVELESRGMPG